MSEPPVRHGRIPWPPILYLAAIAVAVLLHAFYPLPWFAPPMSDILFAAGFLVLFAVAALFFTAISTMRRSKTTIDPNGTPEHLVTGGPFAVTRNPIYLADTLLLVGLAMIFGVTWFLPLALVAAFATQKVAIEKEEKVLAERFGKRYRDYARKVRRWI